MAEFVLRQLAGKKTPGLIAKLRDAFVDQRLVYDIVAVHHSILMLLPAAGVITTGHGLISISMMQFARAAALSAPGTQKRESLGRAKAWLRAAS
jgi:hypothetical protein